MRERERQKRDKKHDRNSVMTESVIREKKRYI